MSVVPTVVATGKYKGRDVKITWRKGRYLDGPEDAVDAIYERSTNLNGTFVGVPCTGMELTRSYMREWFGFTYVAGDVLEDYHFLYPDGEPEPLECEEGVFY